MTPRSTSHLGRRPATPTMAALLSGISSRTLRARVRRLIDEDVVRRTLDEHTAILDAIAARDPALARAAATMHVATTEASLRRMFAARGPGGGLGSQLIGRSGRRRRGQPRGRPAYRARSHRGRIRSVGPATGPGPGAGRRDRAPHGPRRRGLVARRGGLGPAGHRLRLPARRRSDPAARPAVAAPADRGARPVPGLRHGRFIWTDRAWTGRQLAGSVLYELHIGTFTPGGTFGSAIERLDHLVALGVDLVEVLPVNAVDGPRNWGYDGVGWYAVTENYGGPDSFKRFVDACHARGMGVMLDVVYNHLGPSGAYLDRFGPYFAGSNIWGPSINLDGPQSETGAPVRDRQRADVAARLPHRRAAAGRGARPARRPGHPPAGTARGRGGVAVDAPGAAAVADRRVRPERPAHGHPARGRRLRAARAVVRRHPPQPAQPRSPGRRRATTPTSPRPG